MLKKHLDTADIVRDGRRVAKPSNENERRVAFHKEG
jgi:hypothetical protein